MSTSTTNLGLTKPEGFEYPDIDVINGNMDIIDAKMGAVGNTSLQSQITSLQESVSQKVGFSGTGLTNGTVATYVSNGIRFYCIYWNLDGVDVFVQFWSDGLGFYEHRDGVTTQIGYTPWQQ